MWLTSPFLVAGLALVAAAIAALIVALWTRARSGVVRVSRQGPAGKTAAVVGRFAMLGLLLLATTATLALAINNSFGFYTSWDDIAGVQRSGPEPVQEAGLDPGRGTLHKLAVPKGVAGVEGDTLVWLPPQYDDPEWADKTFPVIMMFPGQTGPGTAFENFEFGEQATKAIERGGVPPFVAVFAPIVINPPRDTQCIDVPDGPQAESWLTKDVSDAVRDHYRVDAQGKTWSLMGWSTGGFCAANLALRNPDLFGAAVALGANYVPYDDFTTGDLFDGDAHVRDENTPVWLYEHNGGTRGVRLLMVASEQDKQAWTETQEMARITADDADVTLRRLPTGGHNYGNYRSQIPYSLGYLDEVGAL